jgi:hypothetical protein
VLRLGDIGEPCSDPGMARIPGDLATRRPQAGLLGLPDARLADPGAGLDLEPRRKRLDAVRAHACGSCIRCELGLKLRFAPAWRVVRVGHGPVRHTRMSVSGDDSPGAGEPLFIRSFVLFPRQHTTPHDPDFSPRRATPHPGTLM